ncbi:MAG: radical SAM protein [Proteobacteria bacterium]|nr:radical SAM protein [Pseudomonadota bacterium]
MGLYIHVPYCEAKCHYCDFNSYAGREREFRAMAAALVDDLETAARGVGTALPLPLGTVFIGGGTPSVLPGADVARLIEVARQRLGFAPDVEITSEANPGSLTADWLEKVMAAGRAVARRR